MIRLLLRVLEMLSAFALLAALAMPFLSAHPLVSVGVWLASIAGWILFAKLRPSAEPPRIAAMIPMIPAGILFQYFVDRWIPMLGSAVILVINVAGVARELRQQRIPVAVIRSRR